MDVVEGRVHRVEVDAAHVSRNRGPAVAGVIARQRNVEPRQLRHYFQALVDGAVELMGVAVSLSEVEQPSLDCIVLYIQASAPNRNIVTVLL